MIKVEKKGNTTKATVEGSIYVLVDEFQTVLHALYHMLDKSINTKADSPYRVMRQAAEDKEVLSFEESDIDGTKIQYDAQVSVKRTGGGVNGVIEFELTMIVQSDIVYVDPA